MVANLLMEDFESRAFASTPFQLNIWKYFVDDTFILWSQGIVQIDLFLQNINIKSRSIKFTMESKIYGSFPFVNVIIYKNLDGSFSHKVFHKKTHIE